MHCPDNVMIVIIVLNCPIPLTEEILYIACTCTIWAILCESVIMYAVMMNYIQTDQCICMCL